MKYVDEFRDQAAVRSLLGQLRQSLTRHWTLMEVCGGQTHTFLKTGLLEMLPPEIELIHGPGCPVCVTAIELVDQAVAIAARPEVIFTSFGDMLRVPGSRDSLFDAKAKGADVRIVYSPLDALKLAQANPHRQIVFFAVGFETTAPANAMAVYQAHQLGVTNFSIVVAHVLVPPAMRAILDAPNCRVQAFLAPGHVCTISGITDYEVIARGYHVPVVVTGFEPVDLLTGISAAVAQLEQGRAEVDNAYARTVRPAGNPHARSIVDTVFEVSPRAWRGIGEIPASGLKLRPAYAAFDAVQRFRPEITAQVEAPDCIAGLVLQGLCKPAQCPQFARRCTPENPLGAPMVSSEGACAAYFLYGRHAH